jgi:hypothetical protein
VAGLNHISRLIYLTVLKFHTVKQTGRTEMKVTFIVPKDDDRQSPLSQFAQCRVLPPVGLPKMAGQAGKHGEVSVVDERTGTVTHERHAHVAVFFVNSYNSDRACALAQQYRNNGSHIVFTGPKLAHSADDAERHADSVLLGAGEATLPVFLADFVEGKTKRFYHESKCRRETARNPFMAENDLLDRAS